MRGDFWSKVVKSETCWEYRTRNSTGYGSAWYQGRVMGAHRAAWQMTFGPIPDGLQVLHRCDNPPCVRPDHLFLGTVSDNAKDRDAKARRDFSHLLRVQRRGKGEDATNVKLTRAQVEQIRALAGIERQVDIAARFGISQSQVSNIVRRASWSVEDAA